MSTKASLLFAGGVLVALSCSCVVASHDGDMSPGIGTLTTGWTLDGSSYSDVCSYYQVDSVNVVIVDGAGYVVADEAMYCEDFGVSIDLSSGWYSSEITLVDWDGYAVSDTIIIDVRVPRDTEVFVDVDFPGGSIG
jgi:hypothetical protein